MIDKAELLKMAATGSRPAYLAGKLDNFEAKAYSQAAQILLTAAKFSYEAQAGFLPLRSDSALPIVAEIKQGRVVRREASDCFLAMIRGDADAELIMEWCCLVYQSRQFFPDELLPLLLDMGKRLDSLRVCLRAAMSPHADWLARYYNPDWRWVLYTYPPDGEKASGIDREAENRLLNFMSNKFLPYDELRMLSRFSFHMRPWSLELAQAFFRLLPENLMSVIAVDEYEQAIENYAFFAPLEEQEKLMAYLAVYPAWKASLERLQEIFNFRQKMHNAILAG